jgi:cytidylate kinase
VANLIITIDGPAASGKSTVASLLAEKLHAAFLDTGAMYRAVTLAAMQQNADLRDQDKLLHVLLNTKFQFSAKKHKMTVSINGADVTEKIRDPEVTANARYIASAQKLREELVRIQRGFAARHKKIVTEGRDQGTVAFPNANIKFYLTADPAERAKRRQAELYAKGQKQTIENILKSIEERDKTDINRSVGPLKPADDAIVVDTTNLTIEQVVQTLLAHIQEKNAVP